MQCFGFFFFPFSYIVLASKLEVPTVLNRIVFGRLHHGFPFECMLFFEYEILFFIHSHFDCWKQKKVKENQHKKKLADFVNNIVDDK